MTDRKDEFYRFYSRLALVAQQCWRLGVGDEDCPVDREPVPEADPAEMARELRSIALAMEEGEPEVRVQGRYGKRNIEKASGA